AFCLCVFTGNASAQTSGTTGDCTWALTGEGDNLTLTISGNGAMGSYVSGNAPWYSQRENIKTLVIGNSVWTIGNYAFSNYTGLTSVSIGNSVSTIGIYAFSGCALVPSVAIPNSVTSIGRSAFSQCTSLENITGGNGLQSVGNRAFVDTQWYNGKPDRSLVYIDNVLYRYKWKMEGMDWDNPPQISLTVADGTVAIADFAVAPSDDGSDCNPMIQSVTLPASLQFIGIYAFACCVNLTEIHSKNPIPPALGLSCFDMINKTRCMLYVPSAEAADLYRAAPQWKEFVNILVYNSAAVNEISSAKLQIYITNGELKIENAGIGENIMLFDIAGRVVETRQCHVSTETINISHLSSGIYIVKIGSKSAKFVKE
ncbi:MAG: leucine-rich repeat protein, partial [Dysgonamonadaceae bacterium]|nr:leucine-rich repeat protein [Dysgonamonadaceae bacterium]